ncbi:unnamed protein product [Rhizophagus irregularis]|nr:unnamed protein product [Rhizophagus irregularis]CAB5331041.1 unnamed protein product [Rhizophagus irregularis]
MNFDFRMNILEFRPWNQNQLGLLGRISSDCWIGIGLDSWNSGEYEERQIDIKNIPAESNSDFKILDPLGAHGFYFY